MSQLLPFLVCVSGSFFLSAIYSTTKRCTRRTPFMERLFILGLVTFLLCILVLSGLYVRGAGMYKSRVMVIDHVFKAPLEAEYFLDGFGLPVDRILDPFEASFQKITDVDLQKYAMIILAGPHCGLYSRYANFDVLRRYYQQSNGVLFFIPPRGDSGESFPCKQDQNPITDLLKFYQSPVIFNRRPTYSSSSDDECVGVSVQLGGRVINNMQSKRGWNIQTQGSCIESSEVEFVSQFDHQNVGSLYNLLINDRFILASSDSFISDGGCNSGQTTGELGELLRGHIDQLLSANSSHESATASSKVLLGVPKMSQADLAYAVTFSLIGASLWLLVFPWVKRAQWKLLDIMWEFQN